MSGTSVLSSIRISLPTDLKYKLAGIADFNGDGDTDLATVNSTSANISILINVGDGTFKDVTKSFSGPFFI